MDSKTFTRDCRPVLYRFGVYSVAIGVPSVSTDRFRRACPWCVDGTVVSEWHPLTHDRLELDGLTVSLGLASLVSNLTEKR